MDPWDKFGPCEEWHMWAKFHDSRSNEARDMPVQSLHRQLFAIASHFGPSMPNLPSNSTSVLNFTTFDHMVQWAAINFSGRIKKTKRQKHNGGLHGFAAWPPTTSAAIYKHFPVCTDCSWLTATLADWSADVMHKLYIHMTDSPFTRHCWSFMHNYDIRRESHKSDMVSCVLL